MLCNTAIFYDIENLLGVFAGKANTALNLDEIYRRVLETEGVHGVSIQRAYADWATPHNRALQESVLQVGIDPIQIFNTNQNDRLKNAADVNLIIDAVELLAKRPEIENYVIASGDGIFAFLSKKLHQYGKRVIGCGFDRNSNVNFRYSCDYYISLEKADKALVATTSARTKVRKPEAVPPVVEPAPIKKVPNKFPKTKYSEMLTQADIQIWKDTHDLAGGLHTIRKIIEALFEEAGENLPDLEISIFKTYVDHYIPGFRVNRYDFSRFGEFMRFVLTGSPFCLYTIDESVCKITRRGTVSSKGVIFEDVKGLVVTSEDGNRYGSIFSVPEDMAFIYSILSEPAAAVKSMKTKSAEPPKNGRRKKAEPKAQVPQGDAVAEPGPSDPALSESAPPVAEPAISEPGPSVTEPDQSETASPVVADSLPLVALPAIETVKVKSATDIPAPEPDEVPMDVGSLRRWIKSRFQALSEANAISPRLAVLLETPEYSKNNFGIKTPILKEIETRSNLLEQRSLNGKVRYWKETFMFNGKHYLIYKDWTGVHKERFIAWNKNVSK